MAEEDPDKSIEEEMLRMMEEEAGGASEGEGASDAPAAAGEEPDDLEAQMLAAMAGEGEEGGNAEAGGTGDPLEDAMLQAMAAETGSTPEQTAAAMERIAGGMPEGLNVQNLKRLLDVKLSVSIELGQTTEDISNVLHWTEGSLIELDKVSGEPVDVLINKKFYARGEVVVIAENFGVRITEILPAVPRPH